MTCKPPKNFQKSYMRFALQEARSQFPVVDGLADASPVQRMCTIMAESLHRSVYGAFVPPYLSCGNFLFEEFYPTVVSEVSCKLDWPIATLEIHEEGDTLATMGEFNRWATNAADTGAIYPIRALDEEFCYLLMAALLDDLKHKFLERKSSSSLDDLSPDQNPLLAAVLSRVDRARLVDKFCEVLVFPCKPAIRTVMISDSNWSLSRTGTSEDCLDDLKHWAMFAPLFPPTISDLVDCVDYQLPRAFLRGNEQDVLSSMAEDASGAGLLVVRELQRLAVMPSVISDLNAQRNAYRSYGTFVAESLCWISALPGLLDYPPAS